MKKSNLVALAVAAVVSAGAGSSVVLAEKNPVYPGNSFRSEVFVSSNPAGLINDKILTADKSLSEAVTAYAAFSGIVSLQSIENDRLGRAFVTFDNTSGPATGGFFVVEDVNDFAANRMVAGSNTGLVAPKGVEIAPTQGAVIISDAGATVAPVSNQVGSLKVFADDADENATPLFTVTDLGNRSPWDADYDAASDTLFVATQQGDLLVFNDFFENKGVDGPSKVITPSIGATKVSVNLHGVAYDAENDRIALSDVGIAGNAADGQIFTIANVSEQTGATQLVARISGTNTRLGNPVDIDLKGGKLYVAEKANGGGVVLRYNGIFDLVGELNQAADDSLVVANPESVSAN